MKNIYYLLSITIINLLSISLYAQNISIGTKHSFGSTGDDEYYAIKKLSNGDILLAGSFEGTIDVDPGTSVTNITSTGLTDNILLKLDAFGNYIWHKQFGGTNLDLVSKIDVASDGSIYLVGEFAGVTDMDPSASASNLTSNGLVDVFVLKLNSTGDFVWAKQFGSSSYDESDDIKIDNLGNIFFSGYFNNTIDFDPNAGVSNLTSNGMEDGYVCKLDNSGNLLYVKQFGGTANDNVSNIVVNGTGEVLLSGHFSLIMDADPGAATNNLTSNGAKDVFLIKLASNGSYILSKQFGGTGTERSYALNLDGNENVLIGMQFGTTTDMDPGVGTVNATASGTHNGMVVKLDATGTYIWGKYFSGSNIVEVNDIQVSSNNDVYLCGIYISDVDFNVGVTGGESNASSGTAQDGYILKLDQSGAYQWHFAINSSLKNNANAIVLNANEDIYVCGGFNTDTDIDPFGTQTFTSNGQIDAYFVGYLNTTGIEENINSNISVYPNPSREILIITAADYVGKVVLKNALGQIVDEFEMSNSTVHYTLPAKNGLYFLVFEDDFHSIVKRIVKQ